MCEAGVEGSKPVNGPRCCRGLPNTFSPSSTWVHLGEWFLRRHIKAGADAFAVRGALGPRRRRSPPSPVGEPLGDRGHARRPSGAGIDSPGARGHPPGPCAHRGRVPPSPFTPSAVRGGSRELSFPVKGLSVSRVSGFSAGSVLLSGKYLYI